MIQSDGLDDLGFVTFELYKSSRVSIVSEWMGHFDVIRQFNLLFTSNIIW